MAAEVEVVEGRHGGGRKTLLTPLVQEAILEGVRQGLVPGRAAQKVGVGEATVLEWIARGEGRHPRPSTPDLAEFAEQVKRAEIEYEADQLAIIRQASQGGRVIYEKTVRWPDGRVQVERRTTPPEWTAAAWVLERRWWEQYARKERTDMRAMMREVMEKVAQEQGMKVEEVFAEAQRLAAGR